MVSIFSRLFFISSGLRVFAWIPVSYQRKNGAFQSSTSLDATVGIFFGTSTGNTETVASEIYEAFGSDVAAQPIDVDTIEGDLASAFCKYDALVLGTPTWNTGADTERSGTGWDDMYSNLSELGSKLKGKKVACFGCGDQESYAENYADATGELFDVFEGLGCEMLGSWSQEGYEHEASKAIRGDRFCGLLLDMVNQEELTSERVAQWVAQLKGEGLLETGDTKAVESAAAPSVPVADVVPEEVIGDMKTSARSPQRTEMMSADERLAQLEREKEELRKMLQEGVGVLSGDPFSASEAASSETFKPHVNPVTGKTMWTSPDGRKSYMAEELRA